MRAQGLLLAVLARGASAHWDAGERRDGLEEWRHPHRKRCDMFASVFRDGCSHFCFPGVPHVWAEMLLRLLEQHHHHI